MCLGLKSSLPFAEYTEGGNEGSELGVNEGRHEGVEVGVMVGAEGLEVGRRVVGMNVGA